jgi:hypothetical protein
MIPYVAYKLVHLFGIFLLVASLGGAAIHAANGGTREASLTRRLVGIGHGVALFLILLGGFGMLARLSASGSMALPGWIWGKLIIWVVLGGLMVLPYRRPQYARGVFVAVPTLGLLAAILALTKPF